MEKRLIMTIIVTVFATLSLLVAFIFMHSDNTNTCYSSDCVRTANEILMYVDENADPCNDFYQFACGNFLKDTNLDDYKSTNMSVIMNNILINQIKQMIEDPIKKGDSPSYLKTKSFYRACMNESGIDSQGIKIMKDILKDIGGWPTLDSNWKENDFDWKRATHKLRKIGYTFDLFFSVEIGVNKVNEEVHIIDIIPPSSMEFDIKDRYRDLYLSYITDISVLFGATKSRAEREAKDILEFQDGLRKVVKRSEGRNKDNVSYNPKTISDLHYEIPSIPWFDYINGLLFPSAKITSEEIINVSDIMYIKELLSLLQRAQKRVLANFVSWHFTNHLIEFLPKPFRDIKNEYLEMTNPRARRSRWELCLHSIESAMPFSLKELYVEKYITDEIKDNIREMINNIKRRFDKRIDKFDWLDEQGIEIEKEKIASVLDYVGDYGVGHKDTVIDEVYDNAIIQEDKFILSLLELKSIKKNLEYKTLREPVKHEHEKKDEIYSLKENKLNIPIDYLHGMYFDVNRPKYMNYGAIGSIIARELSNMFLDGRYYDVRGKVKEWSTSQSVLNYENKSKCFSEQYVRLYVPALKKTIIKSMNHTEDLAILAGKIFSYEAYAFWVEKTDIEPVLPGIDYTQKQLFWIYSALYECSKNTPDDTENILNKTNKTISLFKVNGPLRNIAQFAEDFYCPVNSKMNPKEKCHMW